MIRTEYEYETETLVERQLCEVRPAVRVMLSERTVTQHGDGTTVTTPWRRVADWSYEPRAVARLNSLGPRLVHIKPILLRAAARREMAPIVDHERAILASWWDGHLDALYADLGLERPREDQ